MIIVDTALKKRDEERNPIRVALVGAGFMGRAIAQQICRYTAGMNLVAISNRHIDSALSAYRDADVKDVSKANTVVELEANMAKGRCAVTEDALLLCRAEGIDAIIEATGTVVFAASIASEAVECGKHIILFNAELDATLGPILKVHADKAGVVCSSADGDQPGVTMNLYRFIKQLGICPVLCGNIKGLQDRYRNPTTQAEYAAKRGIGPHMAASFADGTKISFEQAIVANGTDMLVAKRGMLGPVVAPGTPLESAVSLFPEELMLKSRGFVDYIVGASPAPGVFILGTCEDPAQRRLLEYYKMGSGPLYCFSKPFHLCHFEVPNSVARAVIFDDPTLQPLGAPRVDVIAAAKKPLRKGEIIDGVGHYMTYGLCENYETVVEERLLPMGLAEGCRLQRDIPKDRVLTYNDVHLPDRRLADSLRREQDKFWQHMEKREEATNE